jgi:hypothetical protein
MTGSEWWPCQAIPGLRGVDGRTCEAARDGGRTLRVEEGHGNYISDDFISDDCIGDDREG